MPDLSPYETTIQQAASQMNVPAFSSMVSNSPGIPTPQDAADLARMQTNTAPFPGGGLMALQDLVNEPGAPSISDVLKNYQTAGTTALNQQISKAEASKPAAPSTDVSGFEQASQNALGGKTVIPQVETNYLAKAQADYQNNLQTWQNYYSGLQAGWDTLNALSDPKLAQALTLDYMKGIINQSLAGIQGWGGTDASAAGQAYQQLQNYFSSTEGTENSLTKFFQNTLALNYDLSSDINQAVMAKNYSGWLTDLLKKPIAAPGAPGSSAGPGAGGGPGGAGGESGGAPGGEGAGGGTW